MNIFRYVHMFLLASAALVLLTACSDGMEQPVNQPVNQNFLLKTPTAKQDFLAYPQSTQVITLGNAGKGIMTWEATEAVAWLELSPKGGVIPPNGFQVVTIKTGQVANGAQATIKLKSNLGTRSLTVTTTSSNCIAAGQPPAPNVATGPNSVIQQKRYVPNQLLIRYEDGGEVALSSQSLELQRRYGLERLEPSHGVMPEVVTITNLDNLSLLAKDGQDALEALAAELSQRPEIRYAEPNYYLTFQGVGSSTIVKDPLYEKQWYLEQFGVPAAWDIETGSQAITLAVLDSGFDTQHEELQSRLLKGCDIWGRDNDVNPKGRITGDSAHGTHVMGIAAALGGNAKGGSGLAAENVRILPVKIANDVGTGISVNVAVKAILWAAGRKIPEFNPNPHPADIMNLSFGGPVKSKALSDAVAGAHQAGMLVFAASGNSGLEDQLFAPANAPRAIAIGSVDGTLKRSCFSNYNGRDSQNSVDMVAPGGALKGFRTGCRANDAIGDIILNAYPKGYGYLAGTSMATPFVSGAAALLWSQQPFLSRDEVKARLFNSTKKDMPFYNRGEYGLGILCIDRALGAKTFCGK